MTKWLGSAIVVASCLGACGPGGDDDASAKGGAGGSAGTAGAGTGGAHAGSAGSSGTGTSAAGSATAGGRGGGGSAGSSTAGASAAVDCTGAFGTPMPVFTVPEHSFGSLTLGPGELELIYVLSTTTADVPNGNNSYQRSVRTSRDAAFAPGSPLPELDTGCADPSLLRTGDLSADGLHYYFVCYPVNAAGPFDVKRAQRASLDAPFVVDSSTFGSVYTGITIAPDELELIDAASLADTSLRSYQRTSSDVPFGPPTILTGLDGLFTPELANDDRTLFAAKSTSGTEMPQIVVATRADSRSPFGAPSLVLVDPDPTTVAVGSAAISGDCRSLYYVRVTRDAAASTTTSTLMLAQR